VKLSDIAIINAGYPFRGKIPEVPSSSVIAVQMKDVSQTERINWSGCLATELTGKRDPGFLNIGDILVAARGSHNYAVLVGEDLNSINKEAVASPHFFVVRLHKENILPDFIAWLLNQKPARRYLEQNAEGTLTKSIRRSVLEDTPIKVPTLEKQRTIVEMANTLNAEQAVMLQLISNSKRMMNAIANDLYDAHDL
jgi:restriction endonuclease S subunit